MNKKKNEEKVKEVKTKKSNVYLVATAIAILIVLGLIGYVMGTIIKKNNFKPEHPVATIEIRDRGTITVELYPEYAPNTVANFIALAKSGFYNELTFHRTIPSFMIQGGDPNGDGTGGAKLSNIGENSEDAYSIEGEFILNGHTQNTLKHEKGVISMARSDYSSIPSLTKKGYNSASSQFFIMTETNNSLDGQYAAFGKVTDGMKIVEEISNVEVETRDAEDTEKTADRPLDPPVIEKITVDTKGIEYGKPETMEPFDYYSYMMSRYYGASSN